MSSAKKLEFVIHREQEVRSYHCHKTLGQGGCGTVYLAKRIGASQQDRLWALKVLKDTRTEAELDEAMKKFHKEVDALKQLLDHPHVPRLEYWGFEDRENRLCFIMEYISGVNLREYCSGKATEHKIMVLENLCRIVHQLHNRPEPVIHRDLKPGNIMLTEKGKLYLLDFGIAKIQHGQLMTKTGVAGTIEYMAPEQEQGKIDHRCDIWALGVMLYELMEGNVPFVAGGRKKRQGALFTRLKWDKELQRICSKALSYRVDKRFDSAGEMERRLCEWRTARSKAYFHQARKCLQVGGRLWRGKIDVAGCERHLRHCFAVLRHPEAGGIIHQTEFAELLQRMCAEKWQLLNPLIHIEKDAGKMAVIEKFKNCRGPLLPLKEIWSVTTADNQRLLYLVFPRPQVRPLAKYTVEREHYLEVLQTLHGALAWVLSLSSGNPALPNENEVWIDMSGGRLKATVTPYRWPYVDGKEQASGKELWAWLKKLVVHKNEQVFAEWQAALTPEAMNESALSVLEKLIACEKERRQQRESTAREQAAQSKAAKSAALRKARVSKDAGKPAVESAPQMRGKAASIVTGGGFRYLRKQTYSCGGKTYQVREYLHEQTGMEFALLPGGSFMMGDNEYDREQPVHEVVLQPFLIAKMEVTQGVWRLVMGTTPPWQGKDYVKEGANNPAVYVSWEDAQKFCDKTGLRLPTEAEWEYACRSGTSTKYYWGEEMDGAYAWYEDNAWNKEEKYAHEVGQKKCNAYGLFDMSGNVWEWCEDWYDSEYYKNSPKNDPTGPKNGSDRVMRGGSFDDFAGVCRSADRNSRRPDCRSDDVGFRAVSSIPEGL